MVGAGGRAMAQAARKKAGQISSKQIHPTAGRLGSGADFISRFAFRISNKLAASRTFLRSWRQQMEHPNPLLEWSNRPLPNEFKSVRRIAYEGKNWTA